MPARRKRFVRGCHFIGLVSRGKSVPKSLPSNSLISSALAVSFALILIGPSVHESLPIHGDIVDSVHYGAQIYLVAPLSDIKQTGDR